MRCVLQLWMLFKIGGGDVRRYSRNVGGGKTASWRILEIRLGAETSRNVNVLKGLSHKEPQSIRFSVPPRLSSDSERLLTSPECQVDHWRGRFHARQLNARCWEEANRVTRIANLHEIKKMYFDGLFTLYIYSRRTGATDTSVRASGIEWCECMQFILFPTDMWSELLPHLWELDRVERNRPVISMRLVLLAMLEIRSVVLVYQFHTYRRFYVKLTGSTAHRSCTALLQWRSAWLYVMVAVRWKPRGF